MFNWKQTLEEAQRKMKKKRWQKLIDTQPKVMKTIVQNGGGRTKYWGERKRKRKEKRHLKKKEKKEKILKNKKKEVRVCFSYARGDPYASDVLRFVLDITRSMKKAWFLKQKKGALYWAEEVLKNSKKSQKHANFKIK